MLIALFCILLIAHGADAKMVSASCGGAQCEDDRDVCGMRMEAEGVRIRLFRSECHLMEHGCSTGGDNAFGVISMDYCINAFRMNSTPKVSEVPKTPAPCYETEDCTNPSRAEIICGIKTDGEGYRVRLFKNICKLMKYNCDFDTNYTLTDFYICKGMELPESNDMDETAKPKDKDSFIYPLVSNDNDEVEKNDLRNQTLDEIDDTMKVSDSITEIKDQTDELANSGFKKPSKSIVVVHVPSIDFEHINDSIANFFAATHVFDLPVREVGRTHLNLTRKRLIEVARPVNVFVPWIKIPKNKSDDFEHTPTLSSCYHKCPRKCPSTYSPVCGTPGVIAREPSLMFQNHCYMDVAQCKMYWEQKSETALSSSYVESSFLFCLGDEMNGMYRFLPLVRTLQHMGRLKKKGRFHYRLKNMKFFNNLLPRQPKIMG